MAFPDDDDAGVRTDDRPPPGSLAVPQRASVPVPPLPIDISQFFPPPADPNDLPPVPPPQATRAGYGDLANDVLGPAPAAKPQPTAAVAGRNGVSSLNVPPARPTLQDPGFPARDRPARPEPPKPQYRDPLMALNNPLTLIALAASLFTRNSAVTAGNAMASAIEAQKKGDMEAYQDAYQVYTQELGKWQREDAEQKNEYDAILKDKKLSLDEQKAKLRTVAHRRGDSIMLTELDTPNGNPLGVVDAREKMRRPVTVAQEKKAFIRARMQEDPDLMPARAEMMWKAHLKEEASGTKPVKSEEAFIDAYVSTHPGATQADAKREWEKAKAQGATAGKAAPLGDPSLQGEAYKNSLPEESRDYITAIAEGREPVPKGKWGQPYRDSAYHLNPALRGTTYGGQAAAVRNFSAGEARRAVRSLETLVGHLERLDSNIDYLGTTTFRTANKAIVAWAQETGDPRITPILADVHAVAEELGRVFKGTVTEGEIHRTLNLLDTAQSIPALHAAAREFSHLMGTRLQTLEREYSTTTGQEGSPVSPEAKGTLEKIEQGGGPPGSKPHGFTPDGKQIYQLPDGSMVVPK